MPDNDDYISKITMGKFKADKKKSNTKRHKKDGPSAHTIHTIQTADGKVIEQQKEYNLQRFDERVNGEFGKYEPREVRRLNGL